MSPEAAELHDAYRRDLRDLRGDLVTSLETTSRQILTAHMRALKLLEDAEARAQTFRDETRAELAELRAGQRQILTLLQRAVEVPAAPGLLGRFVERVGAGLGLRPATVRILVACVLASGLSSLLSACTVYGVMHTRAPATLETAPLGRLYP